MEIRKTPEKQATAIFGRLDWSIWQPIIDSESPPPSNGIHGRAVMNEQTPEPGSSDQMVEALYHELKRLARARLAVHPVSMQPTQLVHELWLKLGNRDWQWDSRARFATAAAEAMRRIVIDHARRRDAARRGGGWTRVTLSGQSDPNGERQVDLIALDQALSELERLDERIAELVKLRFFVGLDKRECAAALEVSERTATRWWNDARIWLHHRLKTANIQEGRAIE